MQPWDRCARLGCGHARHGVRRGEGHFEDGAGACKEPRCTCAGFVEEPRWSVLQRLAAEDRARRRRARRRPLRGRGADPGAEGQDADDAEEAAGAEEADDAAGPASRPGRAAAQAASAPGSEARPPWRPAA